jgi:hypothetical protein
MVSGRPWPSLLYAFLKQQQAGGAKPKQALKQATKQFHKCKWWQAGPSPRYIYAVYRSPHSLETAKSKGHPPRKLGGRALRDIRRTLRSAKLPNHAKTLKQMAQELPVRVSRYTVRRAIKRMPDAQYICPRKVLVLTESQKKNRRETAGRLQCRSVKRYWSKVTFADEKKFSLNGPRPRAKVWCLRGHRPCMPLHASNQMGCNIWAGLNRNGIVGPIWIKERLTGESYVQILKQVKSKLTELYFDDQATPHGRTIVKAWLASEGKTRCQETLRLCSKLPEANIIEIFWAKLEKQVFAESAFFATDADLFKQIKKVCNAMKQNGEDRQLFNHCIAALPDVFANICHAKGDNIPK